MKLESMALTFLVAGATSLPLLAASPSRNLWVPAVAKVTGRGGEEFVSSLRIVNPNAQGASVQLTYQPQSPIDGGGSANGDNTGQSPVTVIVPPNDTLAIEDVVGSKFGAVAPHGISAGGIRIVSDRPVIVLSRTFVGNARSATGVPGTYGFTIPAQTAEEAVGVGDVAYIPYTSASSSTSAGFRSNFIMLNTASAASVVNVKLALGTVSSGAPQALGAIVGEKDYTLAPRAGAQQGDIAAAFGRTGDDTNLTLIVTVKSGGPVAVGLSIIDNAISSLNYAPPSELTAANNGSFGLVLDDGGFGLGGRLDIQSGLPNYLSATLVLACPDGDTAFILQAFGPPNGNTTFTRNADGSWAFTGAAASGGSTSATFSGSIFSDVDGTVFGTLTYGRASGTCSGVQKTYPFFGAKASPL